MLERKFWNVFFWWIRLGSIQFNSGFSMYIELNWRLKESFEMFLSKGPASGLFRTDWFVKLLSPWYFDTCAGGSLGKEVSSADTGLMLHWTRSPSHWTHAPLSQMMICLSEWEGGERSHDLQCPCASRISKSGKIWHRQQLIVPSGLKRIVHSTLLGNLRFLTAHSTKSYHTENSGASRGVTHGHLQKTSNRDWNGASSRAEVGQKDCMHTGASERSMLQVPGICP